MKWLGIVAFVAVLLVTVANAIRVSIAWNGYYLRVMKVTVYMKDGTKRDTEITYKDAKITFDSKSEIESISSVRLELGDIDKEVIDTPFDMSMYSNNRCLGPIINVIKNIELNSDHLRS